MEVNDKVKDENICLEQSGTQQIHVRGNSDSELQALFDCVLKPSSQMPLQKPFKMRNLPKSFFTPPAHRQSPAPIVSHSREGSADSTYGSGNTGPIRVGGAVSPSLPQAQHFRHHSSPASLQQTLSIAQSPNVHAKQHSYDGLADGTINLPPGWSQARTDQGQVYYLHHTTQTTHWDDPRKKSNPSAALQQSASSPQPPPPGSAPPPAPQGTAQVAPPPPPPPAPAMSLQQAISSQPPQLTAPTTITPSPSPTPSSVGNAASTTIIHQLINPNPGQLPSGWEQKLSNEGEIYFINHQTKTTSWYDPRIPKEHQTIAANKADTHVLISNVAMSVQNQGNQQQLAHALPPLGPTGFTSSEAVQRQKLAKLQQERDKYRLRRQELARTQQDFAPRRTGMEDVTALSDVLPRSLVLQPHRSSQIPSTLPSLVASSSSSSAPSVELSFTSADPFMATADYHSRQESADSGLGLGSNYTHPHTPEDFLTMEDVESMPSEELKQNAASPMMVPELESMDSEDLVPSITINDDISAEFLNEMLEPAKLVDNLQTWL